MIAIDKPRMGFGAMLAAPFLAALNFLVLVGETSPRARKIERLNSLSDAELASLGLTRDAEIRRILGVGSAI